MRRVALASSRMLPTITQVVIVEDGGKLVTMVMRDSVEKPMLYKSTSALALVVPTSPPATNVGITGVHAWVVPSPKIQANRQQRAASHEALRRRVQEIGDFFAKRDDKLSAKERLAWLAERVRAKSLPGA